MLLQWSVFMYKVVVYDLEITTFAINNVLRIFLGVLAFGFGMWAYRWKGTLFVDLLFYGSVALLLFSLLAGESFGGATRWIRVGGFTFQPSEVVKYSLIMYLAKLYVLEGKTNMVRVFWKSIFITVGVVSIVFAQPNFSTAIVLLFSVMVTLFLLGATPLQIGATTFIAVLISVVGYFKFEHVRERIAIFLGAKQYTYKAQQVVQAKVSIVRGGVFGKGPGMGLQKLGYLPSADKDYAFSNLVEEYGLLGIPGGALWIVLSVLLITWIGLWAAQRNPDPFRRFVVVGFTITFFTFSFVHIAVNLGVLPPTGLPLPFVSYGGSALVANAFALGYVFRAVLDASRSHLKRGIR